MIRTEKSFEIHQNNQKQALSPPTDKDAQPIFISNKHYYIVRSRWLSTLWGIGKQSTMDSII
jgi:hypothetical protein